MFARNRRFLQNAAGTSRILQKTSLSHVRRPFNSLEPLLLRPMLCSCPILSEASPDYKRAFSQENSAKHRVHDSLRGFGLRK